jgi:hypothetical protein
MDSVIVGNLEIAMNDFPETMDWFDARNECTTFGEGWRLPTKNELNIMYENKDKIGGFGGKYYWGCTEKDNFSNLASSWVRSFINDEEGEGDPENHFYINVRAVKEISGFYSTFFMPSAKVIIGNPITFNNLKIAQSDFPGEILLDEAEKACAKLGEGWRLPFKDELNLLYENRDKIGGFEGGKYWGSQQKGDRYRAWIQDFTTGQQYGNINEFSKFRMRSVMEIK